MEGVGKSFFLEKINNTYPKEFTILLDDDLEGYGLALFNLLHKKDALLRQQDPLVEFFSFSAIDHDCISRTVLPALTAGKTVLQDRGVDTTCLYAALRMKGELEDSLRLLLDIRKRIGLFPDHTICIVDDFTTCIQRAQQRNGKPYTRSELTFLKQIELGFRVLHDLFPERVHLVERGKKTPGEMTEHLYQLIKRLR